MKAVREFARVKNNQVTINIPADFEHEQVEVIVLPLSEESKRHYKLYEESNNRPKNSDSTSEMLDWLDEMED